MKRLISFLVFTFLLLFASLGHASGLPESELALGPVRVKQTLGQVEAVLGKHSNMKDNVFPFGPELQIHIVSYYFGESFEVIGRKIATTSWPTSELPVVGMTCHTTDYATPSGITMGDNFAKVTNKFGQGEVIPPANLSHPLPDCTYYSYAVEHTAYTMSFAVDAQNIIQLISIREEV